MFSELKFLFKFFCKQASDFVFVDDSCSLSNSFFFTSTLYVENVKKNEYR